MANHRVEPEQTTEQGLTSAAKLVQAALMAASLEPARCAGPTLDREQRQRQIARHIKEVLQLLQLDPHSSALTATPERVAALYLDELFSGLDYHNFPKITLMANEMQLDEMLLIRDISLISTCEHHLTTIDGLATIAYIPGDLVIGLGNISNLVNFFARRPQLQERLTRQLLVALQALLESSDVAIQIVATHYCVKGRNSSGSGSRVSSIAYGGRFKSDGAWRRDFCGALSQ